MRLHQIRNLFMDYFASRRHKIFDSDSLVPQNDPSVLFTGAGMNQFKSYFLGEKKDVRRAASCQKCLRTADLERVGQTAFHHTFFEMLGNFSFGDYFKEEAIQYAWEFVTKELKLSKNDLWVSVYEKDQEAYKIWLKKIKIEGKRIKMFSAEDNFWPANAPIEGPNGPCGPCSEIYYGRIPGQGIEIWNLVFTQYDRQDDGFLKPLPQKNIDTGMGLERLTAVMQGAQSNFDIDIFIVLRKSLETRIGKIIQKPALAAHRNALLDHIRAIVFCIADGVMPSNEGRGYVVRKLIRKSVMHLRSMGIRENILHDWVPSCVSVMGENYPELKSHQDSVASTVRNEEEHYTNVLENRIPQAETKIKTIALTAIPSKEHDTRLRISDLVFEFYDTYGVPKDILLDIVKKNGLFFDESEYQAKIENQREKSRRGSGISEDIFRQSEKLFEKPILPTEFVGYERSAAKGRIVGILFENKSVNKLEKGQKGVVVLDRTPFYAEQGGQVGDQGSLKTRTGQADVQGTKWHERLILHETAVSEGSLQMGDGAEAKIDVKNRQKIMNNHTATHLLHSSLRRVLGSHVKQSGSLVAPGRLRFDFTHFQPLSRFEIRRIENDVNAVIRKKVRLHTEIQNTKEAMHAGALAFFGDKYAERVRVVTVPDFSKELCGGTHVKNTEQIGLFRITSESSIQSGVRRVEAVTGEEALKKENEEKGELNAWLIYFNTSKGDLVKTVADCQARLLQTQRSLKERFQIQLQKLMKERFKSASKFGNSYLVIDQLPEIGMDLLRSAADCLCKSSQSCAVVLSSELHERPQVVIAFSKDLVQRGLSASTLIKDVAKMMGGSGGGRPDMAVGGGKSRGRLPEAMEYAQSKIMETLEAL